MSVDVKGWDETVREVSTDFREGVVEEKVVLRTALAGLLGFLVFLVRRMIPPSEEGWTPIACRIALVYLDDYVTSF